MDKTTGKPIRPHFETLLLRGGRMTKYKGQVVSYAPSLGRVLSGASAAALGAALSLAGSSAHAGSCVDTGGGNFVCSGPADPGTDTGVDLTAAGSALTITTEPGFGIDLPAPGVANALNLQADSITFTDNNNSLIRAATPYSAISARTNRGGGPLSITTTGSVEGAGGLIASHNSGGALTLNVADVNGRDGVGISTESTATSTDLVITATGAIAGGGGIISNHYGRGDLSITTVNVTGTSGQGIHAYIPRGGYFLDSTLSITSTGSIVGTTGITAGMYQFDNDDSDVIIDVRHVTGTDGDGIVAYNSNRSDLISVSSSGVVEGHTGINVLNIGDGSTVINAVDVIGTNGDGIYARTRNYPYSAEFMITTTGDVSGSNRGIFAENIRNGATVIRAEGDVTSVGAEGIRAIARRGASITTNGIVSGGTRGISANAAGGATIEARDVTGSTAEGIFAEGGGHFVITSTGTVEGTSGIVASQRGYGDVIINAADVVGTAENGIRATNTDDSLSLTINSTGSISGATRGIYATHNGSEALTINAADVTGTSDEGILATNSVDGTDLSITTTGAVIGGTRGINAQNDGSGALTINAADVSGEILAQNGAYGSPRGTDISITTSGIVQVTGPTRGTSTANYSGIVASNNGSGNVTINTEGEVTSGNVGISSNNAGRDTLITTNANVTGGRTGIVAGGGNGTVTIEANGDVVGIDYNGITSNSVMDTEMSITVSGEVRGWSRGISVYNGAAGAGAVTINAAAVTGRYREGITVLNRGTDVSITTSGAVSGGGVFYGRPYAYQGIEVQNYGTGSVTIDAVDVTGTDDGIDAYNSALGTSIEISARNVTGAVHGIEARNFGRAGLTVTATGDVTGGTGDGINTYNSANDVTASTNIYRAAGTTTSGAIGINADNAGGSLTITALGTTIGTATNGINAVNQATGTALTITANDVAGQTNGIFADNSGTGDSSVMVMGNVVGGTAYGIATSTGAGGMTDITLDAGAAVSSAAGLGISNDAGDSTVTSNTGSSVAGVISLGDGSDNLVFAGGDFSGVTLFDGGDDSDVADGFIDTLTFAGSSGLVAGANVVNWEEVVIDAGSTIGFSDDMLTVPELRVNSGGTLLGSTGILTVTGNVTNGGLINLANTSTADRLVVTGNFTGTDGTVNVDVDFATDQSDILEIGGDTGGTTRIAVNNISTGEATGNDILVVDVTGTSSAGDFELASGPVEAGVFAYDLEQQGNDFFLAGFEDPGLGPDPDPGSEALSRAGAVYQALPGVLLDGFVGLETLRQRIGGRRFFSLDDQAGDTGTLSFAGVEALENRDSGLWLRIHGGTSDVTSRDAGADYSYDSNIVKFQAGLDSEQYASANGSWVFGLFAEYGTVDASVTNFLGSAGNIDADGYGLGATATWYGNNDIYVDVTGRINWIESDLTSNSQGRLVRDHSSVAYGVSIEGGYRHAIDGNRTLIPQAQLAWGGLDGNSLTDSQDNDIDIGHNDRLVGRLGLAYEYAFPDVDRGLRDAYVIGNILHDFDGSTSVVGNGATLNGGAETTQWEVGFGGDIVLSETASLYGEASYRNTFGGSGDDRQGYHINVGMAIAW
ncbi:hypothetical protein RA27_22530 [Ruegeria sp. ANG-R]|uniref:autotransporter outer membrane beta-barrel domain-containing protein n=1 Tax=Ruegeria sp. ANG-R TaxID=1577903 RepID=UPI00057D3129|nr:autotransporter outer membrane beta-barrel domain-containing protein [Ruegeria sp. ANG-R]KIC35910.1 hypothetical protein RA27_22530 [Ruegeria sp. ANG-R]